MSRGLDKNNFVWYNKSTVKRVLLLYRKKGGSEMSIWT
nr:MAG TPA: hypothetical protein [Caudoviricetes sp.]